MEPFKSSPSSSSSVPTGRWTHEVFLSFRGEDTRNNFVDHLYTALSQRGISVFKDDQALDKGKPISRELLKAIEESRFAVVVFSKKYADSSWCLDELVKIMECRDQMGQIVLPVFYHVDPSDVRGQKNDFDSAFQEHEDKFKGEMEKVKNWRKALAAAAGLSGWHIKETGNGGESAILKAIVAKISNSIQPRDLEKHLFGIESRIDELYPLLDMEATEKVHMVGILGMGGIGKTTLAHALFRRIKHNFEGCSFVEDVRENSSSKKDVCALQQKILSDILYQMHPSGKVSVGYPTVNPEYGANMICERFCHKKVLLVLDDVDNDKQLEFLARTHEWFGPGSRIIITTRNEHLLSDADVIYKPAFLSMNEAGELFCWHAFRKSSPPEGYEEISDRAIRYASSLPLALKVLGSFFHGRQLSVWESALNRLGKGSIDKITETLKLSFDGLDASEKQIFLDIACFYKDQNEEYVTRVLDSFGFDPVIGISVLIEKSLITVSNKRLHMHDLIQEMGWQIVYESFPDSRVWKPEQIHKIIKGKKKLKALEAIMMTANSCHVGAYVLVGMQNLRLLDIDGKFTSTQPTFLPDELIWLRWTEYPFMTLPLAHMCKLVGLEIANGSINHLWKERKILPNLKFIHLEGMDKLTSFPDVSESPNIVRLILSCCRSLVEVHESLGSHRGLVYLDMSGCIGLKCLPSRLEMESLETLILSGCYSLERFPKVSPCMVKLSHINLSACYTIKELPSSIRYLSSLSFLNLTYCSNLENIPNSICELKYLKCLHLHNCKELRDFPKELGNMKMLEELWLGFTYDIRSPREPVGFHSLTSLSSLKSLNLSWREIEEEKFPQNLDELSSLEELYLSGNSQLVELPSSICHLSRLKRLEVNECPRLRRLCGLPSSIQVLKANNCSSLGMIGDLSKECDWLYKIWLSHNQKLLEDEENQRYLDNMLQLSFIKKCAAVDHRLSITIPGSMIPSWFEKQMDGCRIGLKLPQNWHTEIMGFVVCGVFTYQWSRYNIPPLIIFRITKDGAAIPKPEVNATETTENTNLWISYIPLGVFQQIYHDIQPEDWSHIQGNLDMTVTLGYGVESVRCGAHVIYKEDVQQITTCICDYGNDVHVADEDVSYDEIIYGNTRVYREKFDMKSLMPLRSRTSARRNTKHIFSFLPSSLDGGSRSFYSKVTSLFSLLDVLSFQYTFFFFFFFVLFFFFFKHLETQL
ncbi:TMV resistance protein N isoform X2 [Lactuca sativa]|uniref:TMV resistance protein N isoform X2 n=1 Tax=Lactuca sativa TaxID=4236 RepID=UPI0022B034E9|nr:TMV resistance protein N isoform X2 [Lactuca sativa]